MRAALIPPYGSEVARKSHQQPHTVIRPSPSLSWRRLEGFGPRVGPQVGAASFVPSSAPNDAPRCTASNGARSGHQIRIQRQRHRDVIIRASASSTSKKILPAQESTATEGGRPTLPSPVSSSDPVPREKGAHARTYARRFESAKARGLDGLDGEGDEVGEGGHAGSIYHEGATMDVGRTHPKLERGEWTISCSEEGIGVGAGAPATREGRLVRQLGQQEQ